MAAEDLVPNAATNKKVVWIEGADPEAAGTTLPSSGWSRNPTANVVNMINGRDGVNRKPSYRDCPNISVSAFYDEVDWAPGQDFSEGDIGYLRLYYTDTKYVQERVILEAYNDDPGQAGSTHDIALQFARERGTAETFGEDTP